MYSRSFLLNIKAEALRKRIWFKLPLEERSIIDLTCRVSRIVKSRVLRLIIDNIVLKILDLLENKLLKEINEVGRSIALKYIQYALKWGYVKAAEWIKNEAYIFHLGLSWINTSPIYKTFNNIKME
ncbi:MAG: hypothetical protein QW803_13130 [Candidatus Methanomethylicia archaeon]